MTRDALLQDFASLMNQDHANPALTHVGELQALVSAGFAGGRGVDFGVAENLRPSDLLSGDGAHAKLRREQVRYARDVEVQVAAQLDALAGQVERASASGVAESLFGSLGFRGDQEQYYAPVNSLLSEVLQRRRGNPITLSVVMIAVAQRRGVTVSAIGMPGHFLTSDGAQSLFFDPFSGGQARTAAQCQEFWARMTRQPEQAFDPNWLAPITTGQLVARTIANLRVALAATRDINGLAWIAELAVHVPEVSLPQIAQMARTLAEFGRLHQGARLYEHAAAGVDQHGDAGFVVRGDEPASTHLKQQADGLRNRLN